MRSARTTALASLLALATAAGAWAGTASETIDRTFKLPPGRQVVVQNLNGSVEVAVWDQPTVRLVAVKTARATTDSRAKAYLHDLDVHVEQTTEKLLITTKTPGAEGGLKGWFTCAGVSGEVAYRLTLP